MKKNFWTKIEVYQIMDLFSTPNENFSNQGYWHDLIVGFMDSRKQYLHAIESKKIIGW